MRHSILILLALILTATLYTADAKAQTFVPTPDFPFIFNRMEKATIHYGMFQDNTKLLPCNIHVGTDRKYQTLVYINPEGTPMETDPDDVNRVDFPDGIYIPIEHHYFGKIVHEDSIGKVVKVYDLDRQKLTEHERSTITPTSKINMDHMTWYIPTEADSQLPMRIAYYFIFNGKVFEVKEKNILDNINQSRRKEYRAYTRAAEVISTNESSILKLWNDFFVNYDKVLPFYKKQ